MSWAPSSCSLILLLYDTFSIVWFSAGGLQAHTSYFSMNEELHEVLLQFCEIFR